MAMGKPLVCLTLTSLTLEENAALVRKYNRYIDVAELRVDFLAPDEQLSVRRFPAMVNVPCILTIRRTADGEIMAIEHKNYPVYGVQFHPESILTPTGTAMVKNFLRAAKILA